MIHTATQEVRDLLGDDFGRCESPSLRLEKFVRLGDDSKKAEIDAVVKCHRTHAKPVPAVEPPGAVSFVARLRSRLIVNQAGGILENAGLCLHPHFGAPCIPGSAVKGIARHAAWCEWYEETDSEKKTSLAADRSRIFGEMSGSGTVAFFSAFPIDTAPLVTDIVNSHHPAYYGGKQRVATDDESPVPVFFPAVESGPRFLFTLVPLRGCPDADLERARGWLRTALSEHGAGAKTAAGYGWFDCDERLTSDWKAAQEGERKKQKIAAAKEAFLARLESFNTMSDSELASHAAEVRNLKNALSAFEDQDFHNRHIAAVNKLTARLPQESPLDALRSRWESMTPKARLGEIKSFSRERNDERKKNIVLLLREPSGVGHDLWQQIRSGQKGDIDRGANDIRAYCKNILQLGKMP